MVFNDMDFRRFAVVAAVFAILGIDSFAMGVAGRRVKALDDSAWDVSVWLAVPDAPIITGEVTSENFRAADGASWFLSSVKNEGKVVSARWMTTALGVYEIYVNGRPVGEDFLKPGFTHVLKTKLSFTYDVTDVFKTAKGSRNTLSAQVTPGWWSDKIVTPGHNKGMYGTRCAFRGVLQLTYSDGTVKLYGTDTDTWKAGIAGPITHSAIYDGEEYDARIKPAYETPELLSKPMESKEFRGKIFPSEGAGVFLRRDLALRPQRSYIWKEITGADADNYGKVVISREFSGGDVIALSPGETLVVDFGQNCSAVPSFTFRADEGTVLTCLPAELLNDGNGAHERGMDGPEGSVHRTNLRIAEKGIRAVYTFAKNGGYVSYMPSHTFFGYRFISVTATGKVLIRKLESIPVSSITADLETGTVTTGNDLINKLISNTLWGMRSNYLSIPTDCPQRDERLGWTADTQVFTETGTFFANTAPFFHKWTRDLRDTQSKAGGYPGVAPLAQYGAGKRTMMRLGWADAGVIVPWTIWKQYGDKAIIEENWAAMEKYMDHGAAVKFDHSALKAENGDYQWADWLSYEPLRTNKSMAFTKDANGKRVPKPEAVEYWSYLAASYWVSNAAMMRDMAEATGRNTRKWTYMVQEAKAYIRGRFFDDVGNFNVQILNTMQTPALFALRNGILEGEARGRMISRLRDNFASHGGCLQTGFLGTSILMGTLTDNGMSDVAYDLLFQRKNPSWLYSIDNGATTIWERWNSYTKENGMGPKGMNSFNHYAYGCVCEWIWKTAAGIAADPSRPGFRHIIMSPVPDRRLGHIEAEYKSAAGLIRSAWKFEGDRWIWDFTVPEGATATVTLPGETASKDYGPGTYHIVK